MLRLKWTQIDPMTWLSALRVRLSRLTFTSIKTSKWHSSITRVHLSKYLSSLRSWWRLKTQKTMVLARLLMWSLVPCQVVSSRFSLSLANLLRRVRIWSQLSQWRWSTSWKRQEMASLIESESRKVILSQWSKNWQTSQYKHLNLNECWWSLSFKVFSIILLTKSS